MISILTMPIVTNWLVFVCDEFSEGAKLWQFHLTSVISNSNPIKATKTTDTWDCIWKDLRNGHMLRVYYMERKT